MEGFSLWIPEPDGRSGSWPPTCRKGGSAALPSLTSFLNYTAKKPRYSKLAQSVPQVHNTTDKISVLSPPTCVRFLRPSLPSTHRIKTSSFPWGASRPAFTRDAPRRAGRHCLSGKNGCLLYARATVSASISAPACTPASCFLFGWGFLKAISECGPFSPRDAPMPVPFRASSPAPSQH